METHNQEKNLHLLDIEQGRQMDADESESDESETTASPSEKRVLQSEKYGLNPLITTNQGSAPMSTRLFCVRSMSLNLEKSI